MDVQQLKGKIRDALGQLDTLGDADPALPGLLQALDRDLRAALDEHAQDDRGTGLGERVREVAVGFAARHPKLEPVLERVMNMLANIGI